MEIDQKERADAYFRNLVAMIWATRCELSAHIEKHGDDVDAAMIRNRLRSLVSTVESVEASDYYVNCEACGKPLLDGQMVIYYDDAGSVHADCDDPSKADEDQQGVHAYESGFSDDQCAAEIAKAKAPLAEGEGWAMSDTRTRVLALIYDLLGRDQNDFLDPSVADLVEDLGADSLDTVELSVAMEEDFSILVTDDEADNAKTVGDWITLVERKVAGKVSA